MDKMKRFIDCYIPTETCNFRCHYCYIAQHRKFNNKLLNLSHSTEFIAKALSKERLGGTCMINLCAGGETLLAEDVIKLIKALLEEGHYLMIVTNGSLEKRFVEISKFPTELLKHLFIKFSFHYMELKRMKLLDTFVKNVNLMKSLGVSYTIEITPTDELEEYIKEIKEFSISNFGALPHITIGRKDSEDIPPLTNHNFEEYKKIWNTFDSEMFNFKSTIFGEKRKEFCYAGEWSVYLNIETGDLRQCYCGSKIDNIYKDINKPIKFYPIGCNCTQPHCYNGHAFLTFGDIPELETPTYDKLRNRKTLDNTEWLSPEMNSFMQSKLKNSNKIYNEKEKNRINKKNKHWQRVRKIKNVAKKYLKGARNEIGKN